MSEPDEIAAKIRRRIDCPVEWCAGAWLEHGGEGQPPEQWVHSDLHGFRLPHGATLSRDQEGSGPLTWLLHAEWDGTSLLVRHGTDLHQIAAELRAMADAINDVAALTDQQ
ncbi:hypothetical protein LG299_02345 [Microbacterium lacus]|uniref:hypothetical protein n=1 Tax=Microbacterium lacus TaxID=415217 RepID=UPI00384D1724